MDLITAVIIQLFISFKEKKNEILLSVFLRGLFFMFLTFFCSDPFYRSDFVVFLCQSEACHLPQQLASWWRQQMDLGVLLPRTGHVHQALVWPNQNGKTATCGGLLHLSQQDLPGVL